MSSAPLPSTAISAEACHSTIKPVTPGLKPVEGRAPGRVTHAPAGDSSCECGGEEHRNLRRAAGRTSGTRTAAGARDARARALLGPAGRQGRLRAARGRGARGHRRARGRGGGARGRAGPGGDGGGRRRQVGGGRYLSAGPGPGAQSAWSRRGGEIAARTPQRCCGSGSPGGPARRRRRTRRGDCRPPPVTPRHTPNPPPPPLPAAPHLEWKHGGAGSDLRRLSARPGADRAPMAQPRLSARPRRPAPGGRSPAPAGAAPAAAAAAPAARRPRRLSLQLSSAAHVSGLGPPRDPGRARSPTSHPPPVPGPRPHSGAGAPGPAARCARGRRPQAQRAGSRGPGASGCVAKLPSSAPSPSHPPNRTEGDLVGWGWGVLACQLIALQLSG